MDSKNKKYKILLTGGGTGGSVMPLLAVAEELNNPPSPLYQGGKCGFEFLWLGTKFGPEKQMVEQAGIKFRAISGGKWRRYFSLKNLADIFKIKIGFWQAFFIMLKWRPDLVMSAGSFSSVPAVWAAWILRVPVIIHQQDVQPGLANRLMAPLAKVITVTFEKSLADYGGKAVWTGNPVRRSLKKNFQFSPPRLSFGGQAIFPPSLELRRASNFQLNKNLPLVLILGGGTGAMAINELVAQCLGELTKFCQVIHVTGKNKIVVGPHPSPLLGKERGHCVYEFLDAEQMAEVMNAADVVVTRAGMGALSELSFLSKPAIIITMPDSHQEDNAEMFKEAGLVLDEESLTVTKFVNEIKNLIGNKELQKELGEKMGRVMKRGANEAMVKIVLELLK